MSCGIGHRCGSDLELLWLWRRPVDTAVIQPQPGNFHMPQVQPLKKKKKPVPQTPQEHKPSLPVGEFGKHCLNCKDVLILYMSQNFQS